MYFIVWQYLNREGIQEKEKSVQRQRFKDVTKTQMLCIIGSIPRSRGLDANTQATENKLEAFDM